MAACTWIPTDQQANAIYLELTMRGFKAWYDNRADDLTKEGMLKGIEQAAAFVLFLSPGEWLLPANTVALCCMIPLCALDTQPPGVLQRPYCQMEIRHALALKKPMVLLHGEPAVHQ